MGDTRWGTETRTRMVTPNVGAPRQCWWELHGKFFGGHEMGDTEEYAYGSHTGGPAGTFGWIPGRARVHAKDPRTHEGRGSFGWTGISWRGIR